MNLRESLGEFLSAIRVQSVALHLIIKREGFTPEQSWAIYIQTGAGGNKFTLTSVPDKEIKPPKTAIQKIQKASWHVVCLIKSRLESGLEKIVNILNL